MELFEVFELEHNQTSITGGYMASIASLIYRKISNLKCTTSENLYDSRLVLQVFLLNPLKSGVKSWMKM